VFVPLFRGHLVKYNYILIFYNIDTMGDQSQQIPDSHTEKDANIEIAATGEEAKAQAGAEAKAQAGEEAKAQAGAEAKAQAGAEAKAKTCVEPMNAAPTEDGDYVMFNGTNYTVFTIKDGAGLPDNVENAKFFKVLPDETKGGKRKSRKSAKKQRKSAKKQQKSAKKQRKSRGSRRSKK
jgi:hypothetical protein